MKNFDHIRPSQLMKWEATSLTRVDVPAEAGTKAGAFVTYPLRNKKYIALTDEVNGKVSIQPHNCVIDLTEIKSADIDAARTNLETMRTEDDAHGIVYIGAPKSA